MGAKDFMGWAFVFAAASMLAYDKPTDALLWLVLAELMFIHADLVRKRKGAEP